MILFTSVIKSRNLSQWGVRDYLHIHEINFHIHRFHISIGIISANVCFYEVVIVNKSKLHDIF